MEKIDLGKRYQPWKNAKQWLAHQVEERYVLFGGAKGGGKLLDITTPIFTDRGWKTMGRLRVGDVVFDERGMPCRVLFKSAIKDNQEVYEVEFDSGEKIKADAEHLWWTYSLSERESLWKRTDEYRAKRRAVRLSRGKGKRPDLAIRNSIEIRGIKGPPMGTIRTTEELMRSCKTRQNGSNHAIPTIFPLQLPEKRFKIDPYILGIWLGDGHSSGGSITTADEEIVKSLNWSGFTTKKYKTDYVYGTQGLTTLLKKQGLIKHKHIPKRYLLGSESQRRALVMGLMDSDGTCSKDDGGCEFTTIKKELAEGFTGLLHSLGIKANIQEGIAKLNGREISPKYRVCFTTAQPVFRLSRKAALQIRVVRETQRWHYIVDIKKVASQRTLRTQCIQVDSPSGCYLAGKGMIPTHNTAAGINEGLRLSLVFDGNRGFMGCRDGTDFKRNAFDQLMYFLPPELYAPPVGVHHKTDQYIKLINGSIIYYGGLGSEGEAEQKINNFPQLGWFFIDQAEQISERQFLMLDGQLRWNKHVKGMIYKAFLTANPSAGWLRDRFIENSYPDHIFIPALPGDNPFLPPDYEQKLREIYPEDMVRRLLEGDWDVPGADALVPYQQIRESIARWDYMPEAGETIAGLDVAEFGESKTVFVVRRGNKVLHIESWVHMDTEFSAGRVAELLHQWKPIVLNIDTIGKGGEVYVQLKNDFKVKAVNVAEQASKPDRFINKRAEYYGGLAKRFEMGEIGLPDHAEMASNLNSLKKKYRAGKLQIESKDLMRKRGEKSPDFADALMLAFIPSGARQEISIYRGGVRVHHEQSSFSSLSGRVV